MRSLSLSTTAYSKIVESKRYLKAKIEKISMRLPCRFSKIKILNEVKKFNNLLFLPVGQTAPVFHGQVRFQLSNYFLDVY